MMESPPFGALRHKGPSDSCTVAPSCCVLEAWKAGEACYLPSPAPLIPFVKGPGSGTQGSGAQASGFGWAPSLVHPPCFFLVTLSIPSHSFSSLHPLPGSQHPSAEKFYVEKLRMLVNWGS